MKDIIQSGEIADVKYVVANELRGDWSRFHPEDLELETKTNLRHFKRTCGDSILEKLCHDFDIYLFFCAQTALQVSSNGGNLVYLDRDTRDHATILIKAQNGFSFSLNFSLFSQTIEDSVSIMGTECSLKFRRTGEDVNLWRTIGTAELYEKIDVNPDGKDSFGYQGTRSGLVAFIDGCLKGRRFILIHGRHGFRWRSICLGKCLLAKFGSGPLIHLGQPALQCLSDNSGSQNKVG